MGFFDRLANVWKGFLSLWISDIENKNPEAVYESAIEERIKKHRELKKAVSGIVFLRNKTQAELEAKEKELAEIQVQIPVAVEEGEDEAALVLIERRDALVASIAGLQGELEKVSAQAEDAKEGLVAFQAEIEKLRREKEEMLAKRANAEARIQIRETLDGLSTDADIKALDNVRESIHKLQAEADVSTEIGADSLDAKLKKIKSKAANATAKNELEEMKKQMAAKKAAAAEAAAVKKTM
ncbi:PspA/IM30 family protein [Myxococcota bacterium]|nr:PspA/IM30 family protein [Myxococcota bacterium]